MTRRIPFAVDCAGEQNHQLGNSTPKARANRRPWCASGHGCPTSQGPNALTSSLHSSCRSQVRLWCSPAMGECVVCPLDFGIHGQGSEPSTKLRSSCILAAFRQMAESSRDAPRPALLVLRATKFCAYLHAGGWLPSRLARLTTNCTRSRPVPG